MKGLMRVQAAARGGGEGAREAREPGVQRRERCVLTSTLVVYVPMLAHFY
jgi:hypothetical protein